MNPIGLVGKLFAGGVGDLVEKVGNAVHQNVTSDKERIALHNEAAKAEQAYNLALAKVDEDLALGQQAVNAKEAESPHLFVAGWRPAVGWVCALTLFLVYVPKAVVLTAFWAYGVYLAQSGQAESLPPLPAFPDLGAADVLGLLGAMLGVGGLRTWEKIKGVETAGVRLGRTP